MKINTAAFFKIDGSLPEHRTVKKSKAQVKGFLAADSCWQDSMYLLQARKYLGFLLEVRKASGKHLAMGMLQGGVTTKYF